MMSERFRTAESKKERRKVASIGTWSNYELHRGTEWGGGEGQGKIKDEVG